MADRDPDEGGDDARDFWMEKCDRGDACWVCGITTQQLHTTGIAGLPLFKCPHCGALQIDAITTPTEDAWLPLAVSA